MEEQDRRPHLLLTAPEDRQPRVYEGGGGGTYARKSYAQHASKVFAEAQKVQAAFETTLDKSATARRYFRMEVPADVSVWSGAGAKLSKNLHAEIVGSAGKNVAHLSSTATAAELLLDELSRYAGAKHIGKSKFAAVEGLETIPLAEKVSPRISHALESQEVTPVLMSLFPDLNASEREAVVQSIRAWLVAKRGSLDKVTEAETGTYLRIRAEGPVLKELAEGFLTVQSVDGLDEVVDYASMPGEPMGEGLQVLPNHAAARAVVIDSGVAKGSRFLDPSVDARENPLGTPYNEDHGTFVASRIVFGDELREQVAAGRLEPSVRIISVSTSSVGPTGDQIRPKVDELIDLVRKAVVKWHTQAQVYNLSMNVVPRSPQANPVVTSNEVTPLAAELDALSRKYRVLFVVSSGNFPLPNHPPPTLAYPEYFDSDTTRILPPGEAMLGLTVGSIATRHNKASLASFGHPSPFTRRGPGISEYRKPDLVAHGGNYGASWRTTEDLATAGIGSDGDRLAYAVGTSFAAPLVSRLAAQLFEKIQNATPELVRALLIHFAAQEGTFAGPRGTDLFGNGRADPTLLLQSTPGSQTFAYTGHIPHREIQRLKFYVPKALAERKGKKRLRVRITVTSTPQTRKELSSSYCMSHVRCRLEKLNESGTIKDVVANKADSCTVHRYGGLTRLEKTFHSHVSGGDWQLLIEHESRWTLQDPALPIAAVITVEDPRSDSELDIMNEIESEVPGRYQLHLSTPVQIRI